AQGSALAVHGVAQGPFHGPGPSYRSVELLQLVLGECTPRRRRRACVVVAFEEQSDLFEGKPHLLRPGEQPNPTNGLVVVSASARFAQRRCEKPAAFVEPECRRSHACQRREFTYADHGQLIFDGGLDLNHGSTRYRSPMTDDVGTSAPPLDDVACTLAHDELPHRQEQWRRLIRDSLISAHPRPTGIELRFEPSDATAAAVATLVEAERQRCAF